MYRWISGILNALLIVPLIGYIWTGMYSRYLQDDYCYAAFLRGENFFAVQWNSYLQASAYSANRYSLTLMMGISEEIGRFTVSLLPGLMVILFVAGFMVLFRQISRLVQVKLDPVEYLMLSAAVVHLVLYQAPNRTQILYWRPGMLPYLAPLITLVWVAAWVIWQGLEKKGGVLPVIGLVLLAFLAAGFSETGAVYQAGILGIAFISALFASRRKQSNGRRFLFPLSIALAGTFLGIIVLVLSPVNKVRMTNIYLETQSFVELIRITTDSLIQYVQYLLYRVTLPTFFAFLLFTAFGWAFFLRYKRPTCLSFRKLVLILVGIQVIHLLLIFLEMAPNVYAMSSAPTARALLAARFTTVITTAISGLLIGAWMSENYFQRIVRWFLLPLLMILIAEGVTLLFLAVPTLTTEPAYPDLRAYIQTHPAFAAVILISGLILGLWMALLGEKNSNWKKAFPVAIILLAAFVHIGFSTESIYSRIPEFRFRAKMWDMRDAQIRELALQGQQEIQVRALDSLDGIAELQETPDHWVNNCAELYYGIDALWAVEPVLNP